MRLCDDVITLFNARTDPESGGKAYVATVIRGVRWYAGRGAAQDARDRHSPKIRSIAVRFFFISFPLTL